MLQGGTFLYPALCKTVILPPLLAHILLRAVPALPPSARLILYLASFPCLFIFRSYLSLWLSSIRAHRLGAIDIPRISGQWPLNLDVLADWAKSGSEEEVGWMIRVMEGKIGRTFNTRVLGEDQVCTW
jgi:hypothetical protein